MKTAGKFMKNYKGRMMKQLAAVLSVVLILALSACGGKKDSVPADLSLEDVYQNIMDAQTAEVPEMFPESSEDLIESYYSGLSDAGVEEKALYMPPVSGAACEIMLVKAKSKDDIPAIVEILQARVDSGKADTIYPDNAKGWQKAVVQSTDRYAAMIVLPEGGIIPENVFLLQSKS